MSKISNSLQHPVVAGEVFVRLAPRGSASARKSASDAFISQLVGVKGTPQHRRPSPDCDGAGCDQPAVPLFIRTGDFLNDPSPNTAPQERRCLLPGMVQWIRRAHDEVHDGVD